MGKKEEIEKEIEILKLELEAEKLKLQLKKMKTGEREPVVSRDIEVESEFTEQGIKFLKKNNQHYQVLGSAGKYDIVLAKRTADHYYCNCPDMKYRGFHQNKACKHIKAFARHMGMHMEGFKAMVGVQV